MHATRSFVVSVAVATIVLCLVLIRTPGATATAQEGKQPFANSIEQRQQTVEELKKLNTLMQKQLDLLQSGKVRVIVVERAADEKPDGEHRDGNSKR